MVSPYYWKWTNGVNSLVPVSKSSKKDATAFSAQIARIRHMQMGFGMCLDITVFLAAAFFYLSLYLSSYIFF